MKILAWKCDGCGHVEPVTSENLEDYSLGDSEPCVACGDLRAAAIAVALEPACEHCPERLPATCFGRYESMEESAFACDVCCGHACEDGHCEPLEPYTPAPDAAEQKR